MSHSIEDAYLPVQLPVLICGIQNWTWVTFSIWISNLFSAVGVFLYEVDASGVRKYVRKPWVYSWKKYWYIILKKYWFGVLEHSSTNWKLPVHQQVRSLFHSVWFLTQSVLSGFVLCILVLSVHIKLQLRWYGKQMYGMLLKHISIAWPVLGCFYVCQLQDEQLWDDHVCMVFTFVEGGRPDAAFDLDMW